MDLKKWIENIKWYKGNSGAAKELSASKVGDDMLRLYLAKTAKPNKAKSIGSWYVGSGFHLGMETKLCDESLPFMAAEVSMSKVLSNGWKITGTADVVNQHAENIHDYKTLSATSYIKMKRSVKNKSSLVALQLGTLMWLNDYNGNAFVECFITDWKPWRKDHPANGYQQLPVTTYSSQDIEAYLVSKTDQLQHYIDEKKTPPECDDVMWIVYEGDRIKLKCQYYCDYSEACPYFNSHGAKVRNTLTNIGGW